MWCGNCDCRNSAGGCFCYGATGIETGGCGYRFGFRGRTSPLESKVAKQCVRDFQAVENEIHVPINSDQDIVTARQKGRSLAATLGFSSGDATLIATAISE